MASKRGPRGWKKRIKSALLNVISLGRVCASVIEADDELRGRPTRQAALQREVEQLQGELRVKDARMGRLAPRRRPHYTPMERMAILELRAARGWSVEETSTRFHVSEATIVSWERRCDDDGLGALLQLREPVNRFSDLVRAGVRRLKMICPRLGKDKIAEMFCRAGVQISASTVSRIVKERGPAAPPPAIEPAQELVRAKRPNEAWLIDLTTVPIGGFGFWVRWLPFSVPQCWPFCYWVAAVVDMYSRRVQGLAVFRREPAAKRIRTFLTRVVRQIGARPRYLVNDHDPVFKNAVIRRWCGRRTRQKFGAVGRKGSIAILERFFLTLKTELTRVIFVTLCATAFRRELRCYTDWFNELRPHSALAGRTPDEAYEGRADSPDEPTGGVLRIECYKRRRHLPVVTTRRAA